MSNDNRHPREVNLVTENEDPTLGYIIDVIDPDVRLKDGREPERVNLQIKPHPQGFQYTLWWEEDGERKQRDDVIRFSDPRDELRG